MEFSNKILSLFLIGGDFVLYILIAMSIVTIAVILERFVVFSSLRKDVNSLSKANFLLKAQKRLTLLATFGNNAPFIGLFGTVLGVIKAFQDLAINEGFGIKVVMGGISEALVATAMGLLVAIPAVMAYNYFTKTINNLLLVREANEE